MEPEVLSFIFLLAVLIGANFLINTSESKLTSHYLKGKSISITKSKTVKRNKADIEGLFKIEKDLNRKSERAEYAKGIKVSGSKRFKSSRRRYEALNLDYGERVILVIKRGDELSEGDIIRVKGSIKYPDGRRNPKVFDYRSYLKSKSIYTIVEAESIQKRGREDIRGKALIGYIDGVLNGIEDEKSRNLMKSAFTGDKLFLDEDHMKSISESGLSHIMAVSGFHIGLIYGMASLIMTRLLRLSRRLSRAVSLIAVFTYIMGIGAPVSALRAFLMILGAGLGIILERRSDGLNILGFIGFAVLTLNPTYFYSVSFILSFSGVLSIYLFSEYMKRRFTDKLGLNILLSISAGTYPISAVYFNNISVSHFFSNLFGMIPFKAAFYLSAAGLILNPVSESLSKAMLFLSGILLRIMHDIIDFLRVRPIEMRSPDISDIFVLYGFIFIGFGVLDIKSLSLRIKKAVFQFALLSLGLNMFLSCFGLNAGLGINGDSRVKFVDIGQGNAAVISHRGKSYLFDTGESNLPEYLLKNGFTNLEALFISHFDSDHCADAAEIIRRFNVKNIYISHFPQDNSFTQSIKGEAEKSGSKISIVEEISRLGAEGDFRLIPPEEKVFSGDSENEKSLTVIADINGRKILLPGDIEEKSEEYLSNLKLPNVDVLNVPHHGSSTSSSSRFLRASEPKLSVIQCGVDNRHSHPSEEVLDRYRSIKSKVLRNDMSGEIEMIIDRDGRIYVYEFLNMNLFKRIFKSRYVLIHIIAGASAAAFITYQLKRSMNRYSSIVLFGIERDDNMV